MFKNDKYIICRITCNAVTSLKPVNNVAKTSITDEMLQALIFVNCRYTVKKHLNVVFVSHREKNLAAILAAYFEVFSPFLEQCATCFTLDQFIEEYQARKVQSQTQNIK